MFITFSDIHTNRPSVHMHAPEVGTTLAKDNVETAGFLHYNFFPIYIVTSERLSTCMQPVRWHHRR